jgi:hypothetical protein
MGATIEDHVQNLKMLLFIRQAWSIAHDVDVGAQPGAGDRHVQNSGVTSRDVWEERWKQEWDRSWAWFKIRAVPDAPISQEEMREISGPRQDLHPLVPPFWPVEYSEDGVT